MDISLIDAEMIELLSRLTGQKLRQQDLSPPIVFIAAVLSILAGVMFADGQLNEKEKQRWQATLNQLVPIGSELRKLMQILNKNIQTQKIYTNIYDNLILVTPFSDSEKLLLLSFGYQMSTADGHIDTKERKYLEDIGHWLWIDSRHLQVLEAAFSGQVIADTKALDEVYELLDPARFQSLDSVFVKAASHIISVLPLREKQVSTQNNIFLNYHELIKFQAIRKGLEKYCQEIYKNFQACVERNLVPSPLLNEINTVAEDIKKQSFRVAIIGEFSKGKSTLINAILGKEIQPVRAIPCSGTITVLRHGETQRTICVYKNGTKEEISVNEYKTKAAISEQAALEHRSEELAQSEIQEIIFEHPNLELCRNGVEIVDSPGLNEHPDRTAITMNLLKNTDAVIFMTSALQILTQGERQLIRELQTKLNGGDSNQPANNLFVVVNFMDNLQTESDCQQIKQLVKNFLLNGVVQNEEKIHFLSAQKVIEARKFNLQNDYLTNFQFFLESLEKFLIFERGSIETQKNVAKMTQVVQEGLNSLHQVEAILNGKLQISDKTKYEILEQIGELSGCDYRIQVIGEELAEEAFEEADDSGEEWLENLPKTLEVKIKNWSSDKNQLFQTNELVQEYIQCFIQDIRKEIDSWAKEELYEQILKPKLTELDQTLERELKIVQKSFSDLDEEINTDFSHQLDLKFGDLGGNYGDFMSYFLGGLSGGGLGFALLAFIGIGGPIAIAAASLVGGLAGSLGFSMGGVNEQIKLKVFQAGCEKFFDDETIDKLTEKIAETINLVFTRKINGAIEVIEKAISLCENLLEQEEKVRQNGLEEYQKQKSLITQKIQELEEVKKQLALVLTQTNQ